MALLVLAVADLMTSGLLCTLNDRCCTVFLFHSFKEQLESVTGGTWVNVMGTKAVVGTESMSPLNQQYHIQIHTDSFTTLKTPFPVSQ